MLLFYSCYFAKWLSQKKKGIQTDHLGKGKTGKTKAIEKAMQFAACMIPAAELFSIFVNESFFRLQIRIFGVILAGMGTMIFGITVITMRDSWRAGISPEEKTALVTHGIFQYSRNPAFLGFDLMYTGIFLIFGNWLLLLSIILGIGTLHLQIVYVEEPFLRSVFGDPYAVYCTQVRRYLGRK